MNIDIRGRELVEGDEIAYALSVKNNAQMRIGRVKTIVGTDGYVEWTAASDESSPSVGRTRKIDLSLRRFLVL